MAGKLVVAVDKVVSQYRSKLMQKAPLQIPAFLLTCVKLLLPCFDLYMY